MRPTASPSCVALRSKSNITIFRLLARLRGDGTIDAISLPEGDLTHPLKDGVLKRDVAIVFLKPTAAEQEASEEKQPKMICPS